METAFSQDDITGILLTIPLFIIGFSSFLPLSSTFAGLFTKQNYGFSIFTTDINIFNVPNKKHTNIANWTLIFLIGAHFIVYVKYFNYSENSLQKNGVVIETVVKNRIFEKKGKNDAGGYYIYYDYSVDGEIYEHNTINNFLRIGDILIIKYLPENPENHQIINSSKVNNP